ncbi:MAG: PIN domain-containing protein [Candidatus Bipolaricaulis sp.]|nr:PIN domain-containing protein [Candidatus Bipolaricaulis sp.]
MNVFVDTSAFYALADESDRNHRRAKAAYSKLAQDRLVTTDHVLVECWFLIGSRLGRDAAIEFWDALRSGIVRVVEVTASDLDRAREIVERFSDQTFSLVDATSFALMERAEIETAFALDAHFRVYRFGKTNERRFDVVPA